MSRSKKKYPGVSDYSSSYTPWSKRQASKKVRRYFKSLTNGNLYKRVYPTWDIFDYRCLWWDSPNGKAYRK